MCMCKCKGSIFILTMCICAHVYANVCREYQTVTSMLCISASTQNNVVRMFVFIYFICLFACLSTTNVEQGPLHQCVNIHTLQISCCRAHTHASTMHMCVYLKANICILTGANSQHLNICQYMCNCLSDYLNA